MNQNKKYGFMSKYKYCDNCLSPRHTKQNCLSKFKRLHCHKNHNTFLHSDSNFSKASTGSKKHINASKQEPLKGTITQNNDSVVKVHSHFSNKKKKKQFCL